MTPEIGALRTLSYFGRVWASGLALQLGVRPVRDRMLRPHITGQAPEPTPEQVLRFLQLTGARPETYRDRESGELWVPPLFGATWGLAELARALAAAQLPVNFTRVLHAASRVEVYRLTHACSPVLFNAFVETVVRTGKRVRIELRLRTSTPDAQPLATYEVTLVVPDRRVSPQGSSRPETVPQQARALSEIALSADEGWRYATVSGDFNPLHWSAWMARLVGFAGPIAHGFDLMARMSHVAVEQLAEARPERLRSLSASFVRPVALPAALTLYAGDTETTALGQQRTALWLTATQSTAASVRGYAEFSP